MRKLTVERDWITQAGFRAVVIMGDIGHRCGYVGVPKEHPLHGVEYGQASPAVAFPHDEEVGKRGIIPLICCDGEARLDVVFDVHGGLTYSGSSATYPVESDLWWFGYDCGHAGDAPSEEYRSEIEKQFPAHPLLWAGRSIGDVHRDLAYCENECESLAGQLVSRVRDWPVSEVP